MRRKKVLIFLFSIIFLFVGLTGCGKQAIDQSFPTETQKEISFTQEEPQTKNQEDALQTDARYEETGETLTQTLEETRPESINGASSPFFEIRVLDVGQGLSVLIQADGSYMLYDGGGRNYSSYVVSYLQKNQIDSLTYLVASHYDEDHINGLVGVLATTPVETALIPDYETDTNIYRSFCEKLAGNGATVRHPVTGDIYYLGGAEIQVVSPNNFMYEDANNNSIAIRVSYGNFSCIITGDAETEAEEAMLRSGSVLKSNLYVVGHHGSSSSTSQAFMEAVSPEYAVISVGEGNSYGHPTEKTLNTLKAFGVTLYRTDKQGEIRCSSDGNNFWLDLEGCNDWSSSETKIEEDVSENSEAREYILNTHTKKIHLPSCSSVSDMSEKNKEIYTGSKEELLNQGYEPCKRCNP